MFSLLYIPWFQAKPWIIPLPFEVPIFRVHEIPLQPFGILVALAVIVGQKTTELRGRRYGIPPAVSADFVFHVVLWGFVFGYVLNVVFYEPVVMREVWNNPAVLLRQYLGLSSYGGFIGAIFGMLLWKIRRRLPLLPIADATAFAFPFAWFLGRLGCFVVHDHPGQVTDFPLAVADYRVGPPPYAPRHDLGLYEALWCVFACLVFLAIRRRPHRPGFFLALLPMLYAPARFFLDYLRAPPSEGGDLRYAGFTPGQYASIALYIIAALFLYAIHRGGQREDEGEEAHEEA